MISPRLYDNILSMSGSDGPAEGGENTHRHLVGSPFFWSKTHFSAPADVALVSSCYGGGAPVLREVIMCARWLPPSDS
jgi:hypothetical protein